MKRIVFILAGGGSQRMGGRDKALILLHGARLIDRAIERVKPQADRVLISAPHHYRTGLELVPDTPGAPQGPVGAIYSIYEWVLANEPGARSFFTAPVDGPFAPSDLLERLGDGGETAIASDGEHDHPTFACWTVEALSAVAPKLTNPPSVSLKALAEMCAAQRVVWRDAAAFLNINTPEELRAAGDKLDNSA